MSRWLVSAFPILAALALACGGGSPQQQSRSDSAEERPEGNTSRPSSPPPVAAAVSMEEGVTYMSPAVATAQNVDPGVRVPELPPRRRVDSPLVDDGRPASNPPQRDDLFAPGAFGSRFITPTIGDPKTFNVMIANESTSNDVLTRMYAGLLTYNNVDSSITSGQAVSWEHDASGTQWTFRLREGLVFSDGSPITSEDYARFFRVVYTEGLVNPMVDALQVSGEQFTWETPDPLTVIIRTPGIYSMMELQGTAIFPLPEAGWEDALNSADPADAINNLYSLDTPPAEVICNGAFMLGTYRPGESVTLVRNPNFQVWDEAGRRLPYFDEFVFLNVPDQNSMRLRFAAGETHAVDPITPDNYVAMRDGMEAGNYTVWDLGPTLQRSFFWFNLKRGVLDATKESWFQRLEFRQACAHALDREAMAELVFNGRAVPKTSFESPSNTFWYNPDATHYLYDPGRAAELLDSIDFIDRDGDGIREDPEGNPIRFSMVTNRGNNTRERMIVLVQEDLRAIGIDMVSNTIDFNDLVSRINDTYQYDACLLGLTPGSTEPATGLNALRSAGRTHLWNPSQETPATAEEARIDVLCDQMLNTLDRAEQQRCYFEIQDQLGRGCFMIYTVDYVGYVGTSNRVSNWAPGVVDPRTFWNIESLFLTPTS